MAFINTPVTEVANPIDTYIDIKKGKFVSYNKDVSLEEEHKLNRFVILDKTYGVKGSEWSDLLKKYISRVHSNDIRKFDEILYVVKTSFGDAGKHQELIHKDVWKNIKETRGQGVNLNMFLIVLDCNDLSVKSIPFQGNNFFIASNFIKKTNGGEVLSMDIDTKYTNGKKDKDGNEILVDEAFVDGLKGTEAATYKKTYILKMSSTGEAFDDNELLLSIGAKLDEHFKSRNEFFNKKYNSEAVVDNVSNDATDIVQEAENMFAQPNTNKPLIVDGIEVPF